MASYVSQYRGIGQMQPSGYTELLASGGQSIADGISKFGDSVGDAIKRYQEQKQKSASLDGILEARGSNKISKFKGQIPPDADMSKYLAPESPEMQKLWSKFSSGKASYDDKLRLAGYESAMSDLEDRARKREVEELQLWTLERAKQTQETLDGSLGAALGVRGRSTTSSVPVSAESYLYGDGEADVTDDQLLQMKRMAVANNPTHLSAFVDAVKSGTATPEQRAEVERYFSITNPTLTQAQPSHGTSGVFQRPNLQEGQLEGYLPAAGRIIKNIPSAISGAYSTWKGAAIANQDEMFAKFFGSGSRPQHGSQPTTDAEVEAYARSIGLPPRDVRIQNKAAAAAAAAATQAPAAAPQPPPQPPVIERLAAPSAPELSRQVTTQAPATPEDQFSAALKWISENGHKINSDVITQLKDKLNLADVRVVKGDGYDVVMVNGEAKHIDTSGGKRLTPTEAAALEARSIYPESGGGFVGVAPTADEAKKFREMVASDEDTARGIDALLEIANRGGKLNPKDRADAAVISTILKARNRLNIVGPGAVSEADWILLDSAFQNPTQIVTLKDMNKQKLKQTRSQLRSMLESTAKSLGLQPVESLGKGTAVGGKQVLTFSSNGKLVE